MPTASPAARLLACTALAPCLFAAAPALADEAMDSAAAAPGIVVLGERDEDPPRSATKLPLEVIDTPQSVSVIGQDLIEDFGFDEINDALAVVPGINVEQVETDRTYYTARGFDISWLMVDGLATPNVYGPTSGALDTVFYQRVEVVRGANALLSGIGNPAGTINFVRRRPTGETGGSAALIMAWYHPEWYRRVLTTSGTFVNQQWPFNPETPGGAWDFHDRLIPQSDRKPLRIFLAVGDRDNFNPNVMRDGMHDWVLANNRMAKVLKAKGYQYQYLYCLNAGHGLGAARAQITPHALEWLWHGYPDTGTR